jgi:hypothetical protein
VIPGVSGRLISTWFLDELLPTTFAGRLGEASRGAAFARFTRWWREAERRLGPASSLRAVADVAAEPLAGLLGFASGRSTPLTNPPVLLMTLGCGETTAVLMVTPWRHDLAASWRATRRHAHVDTRWALAFNGTALRLLDAQRPYATQFLEFDLEAAAHDERAFAALWGLLRAESLSAVLDEAIEASRRHAAGVCRSLRDGVLEALQVFLQALLSARKDSPGSRSRRRVRRRRPRQNQAPPSIDSAFEQALTIVYRILFLLFAEARGLVPVWQPIYRDAYTIERLRDLADGPGDAHGLWESLQAITRLAASGCHVGDLVVTAFNGRLFSPARTPLGESCALDDEQVRRAVRALSSRPGGGGRERVAYRDLDVEQLGAVYESVLDYVPRVDPPAVRLEHVGDQRKATGSFYTPRSITDYLVRRTLSPLVRGLAPDAILRLRVVDPAMGSGAFLVAACRYLARRYELAILDRDDCLAGDIGPDDRSRFRRLVAQHCLFGVDANPTAVQLARLSLWLATLAADRPLTFLDHHLAAGDSLIGASLDDLARQPPGGHRRAAELPLFELDAALEAVREALPLRLELAATPDDSAEIVRGKERTLARLADSRSRMARWKAAADLWCAAWFVEPKESPNPALFAELTTAALGGTPTLPPATVEAWHRRLRSIAAERRFFHWTLEFPEVFFDEGGSPLQNAGFDAVIGNPPWEMLRADGEQTADRVARRADFHQQLRFLRGSGQYRGRAQGHPNLYQLFVERALALVRQGGRIGLVVPAGLFTDQGSATLRARLLDRCAIDTVVGMDNRAGIFPIHRSMRFLLLTAANGEASRSIACRFHETDPAKLDAISDESGATDPNAYPIVLTRATIDRLGGSARTIPLPRCPLDLLLMEKLAGAFPPLAAVDGWGAHFGRELNATDDRPHFGEPGQGLPVVEGKQLAPFSVDLERSRHSISRRVAASLAHLKPTLGRARLAYRDVAGAGNRLTLIAAILPADCVTTHTVFCLKTPLDADAQAFLCALLNSLVLNYLVRQRVMTHVTTAVVHELPVPRPARTSQPFRRLVGFAHTLSGSPHAREPMVALQAAVARLYGLTRDELRHLLSTFPLLDGGYLDAVQERFNAV